MRAEVGTALVVRVKFIRTSVRKVSGATDKAIACRHRHTGAVLILLPPSEKKSPTPGPAIQVYTGGLYAALGWATLTNSQQQRAQSLIAIISAKYGVVRPCDPIEPYKEKIDNKKLAAQVGKALDGAETELIIDCRSSTYQTVWQSPAAITVEVKVFTRVAGVKKVITHMSKKTRGEVTREILKANQLPKTPEELRGLVAQTFECELITGDEKNPWVLEVFC